jgi:hypothetical protein
MVDGTEVVYDLNPYARTGPGRATDGKPKFDLRSLDARYFDHLRELLVKAQAAGVYAIVMLFDGWAVSNYNQGRRAWEFNPYNGANNVNGVDGDANGDGDGEETHTLGDRAITGFQDAYVRRVIDTTAGFDNVLFEIANESGATSKDWQYRLIDLVEQYQSSKGLRFPIGMTSFHEEDNAALDASDADWVSEQAPRWNEPSDPFISDPPPADGEKVRILDTDHLGVEALSADATLTRRWVWKSFLRGYNPVQFDDGEHAQVIGRSAMKHTAAVAATVNLARMTPSTTVSSTRYALHEPGVAYLVYRPADDPITVDLSEAGDYVVTWRDATTGRTARTTTQTFPAGRVDLESPVPGQVVVSLVRASGRADL